MKRASFLLALVIVLGTSVVSAAGIYEIPGSTFSGGGGHAGSGPYSLGGSLRQPIAGVYGNGSYELCAGLPGCGSQATWTPTPSPTPTDTPNGYANFIVDAHKFTDAVLHTDEHTDTYQNAHAIVDAHKFHDAIIHTDEHPDTHKYAGTITISHGYGSTHRIRPQSGLPASHTEASESVAPFAGVGRGQRKRTDRSGQSPRRVLCHACNRRSGVQREARWGRVRFFLGGLEWPALRGRWSADRVELSSTPSIFRQRCDSPSVLQYNGL